MLAQQSTGQFGMETAKSKKLLIRETLLDLRSRGARFSG